jgi:hypothetical protein
MVGLVSDILVKCFLVCSVLEVVGSFCTYWPKIFDARSSLF